MSSDNQIQDKRKTTRFSVDLGVEQHQFLKIFSAENDIKASVIMRALIYLMEIDESIANRVIDIIFEEKKTESVK